MKNTVDYKSRFRILKGGKISLVVSALLVGSSLIGTSAHAGPCITSYTIDSNTSNQSISMCDDTSVTVNGPINVTDYYVSLAVSGPYSLTLTNNGTVSDNFSTGASAIFIANVTGLNLTNNGTINATASDYLAKATGIELYNSASADLNDSQIINNGTINVTANGEDSSYPATGISLYADGDISLNNTTISNDGNISVTSSSGSAAGLDIYAYYGDTNITDSNFINNENITVTAEENAYGMQFRSSYGTSVIDSTIINDGHITVQSTGSGYGRAIGISFPNIRNFDGNSSIVNTENGVIDVSSTNNEARGISVDYAHDTASIVNSGTINVTAGTNARGIYAYELYDNVSVTNSGTISVTATNKAIGIYTDSLHDNSSITNSGTIEATGNDAYGIRLDNPMHATSSIINEIGGVITATSTGDEAHGIEVDADLYTSASIVNKGTINAIAIGNWAYGIDVRNMGEDSSITNSETGVINASAADARAYGIYVHSSLNDSASVVNNGTIMVDGHSGAHGLRINYASADSNITNNGTITATIDGVADYRAYSLVEDTGTDAVINNTANGVLNGNLTVAGTLINAGLISLPHNATGSKYAQADNFIQTATGTLEIGLFSDATLGEDSAPIMSYSQLRTTNASFADGSTIAVNVLTLSENQALLAGQTLEDVVTASTSLTLDGTLNITDNSALLNFEYFTSATGDVNSTFTNGEDGAIHLNIVGGQTILDSSIAGDGNTNTQSAAAVLDAIQDGDYPAMDPVFTALNTLPTDAAVAQAVESTTPVAATASARATRQISNGVQSIVESRQRANIGEGLNSGAEVFGEKNLWIKPFASFGNQANKDGMNGFDVNTAGLGFGMDAEYASNQKIGLALFYTKAYVDVNNMAQSSNLGVFSTLVYGNIPLLDDKTNFLYQFGYAWQKTDSNRHISLAGSTANADYTTSTASVDLKVIRDYSVSKNLLLQPMVGATYRNFMSPDYAETGAGVLNLQSDKFSTDELIIGVGTLAHLKLDKDSKLVANVNVGYDTYGKEGIVTSSYEGASGVQFDTNGIDNGRWSYDLGLGYEKDVAEGHNLNFSYNYQGEGSTFKNHVLSAKYVFSF
jgi:uncharacterized protein with beta-barrel porin domain